MTQKEQARLDVIHRDLVEVKEDISELKLKLLNPDDGAIARANRNTTFRKEMEPLIKEIPELIRFQKNISRIVWITVTAVVALIVRVISMHT
jgi:hypothetical protein